MTANSQLLFFRHTCNEGRGPILELEVKTFDDDGISTAIVHRWKGTGEAANEELGFLVRHLESEGHDIVAEFVRQRV